ncbi:MAG: hypothetical protein EXS25_09835 [Pedosphaera sp.]|nr:hypothetical protein [Pedosphaera sp.]
MNSPWIVAVGLLGACTQKASACAACFGKTDAPLAQGMNAGIFVMLAIVVGAWIAFGSFFVFIARRSRLTETTPSTDPSCVQSTNPISQDLRK